jgi:hypothetical protein
VKATQSVITDTWNVIHHLYFEDLLLITRSDNVTNCMD